MKNVGKYNLYKGLSFVLTAGAPIGTAFACSDMFVHETKTSISMMGVIAICIAVLIFKDKILENVKFTNISVIGAIICGAGVIFQNVGNVMAIIGGVTAAAGLIDSVTFKSLYTQAKAMLPKGTEAFTHFGFIFTTTERLGKLNGEGTATSGAGSTVNC